MKWNKSKKPVFAFTLLMCWLGTTGVVAQEVDSAQAIVGTVSASAEAITTDAAGNIFLAGYFTDSVKIGNELVLKGNSSRAAMFIASFTGAGTLRFGKVLYTYTTAPIQLETDREGNVYLASFYDGTVYLDGIGTTGKIISGTGQQVFIVQMDSSGTYKWHVNTAGAGVGASVERIYYQLGPNGTVYWMISAKGDLGIRAFDGKYMDITGIGNANTNRYNTLIMKTVKSYYRPLRTYRTIGASTNTVRGNALLLSDDQLVVSTTLNGTADYDPGAGENNVTGNSAAVFCAVDTSLEFRWAVKSTLSKLYLMERDSKGKIRAFGHSSGVGIAHLEFVQLSMNGTINSETREAFSSGFFELTDLGKDQGGNIFLSGTFSGSGDFDPTTSIKSASSGLKAPFLVKYDPANKAEWLVTGYVSTSTGNGGTGVHLDPANHLYWCGKYSRQLSFSGPGSIKMPQTNKNYGFLAYLKECKYFEPKVSPLDTILCLGESVQIQISGVDSIDWWDGSNAFNREFQPDKKTIYSATTTDGKGCFMDVQSTVDVRILPSPNIALADSTCTLSGNWKTVQWFVNGIEQTSQTGNTLQLKASGLIHCIAEDSFGCRGTSDTLNYFHSAVQNLSSCHGIRILSGGRSFVLEGSTGEHVQQLSIRALNGTEVMQVTQPRNGMVYPVPASISPGIYLVRFSDRFGRQMGAGRLTVW